MLLTQHIPQLERHLFAGALDRATVRVERVTTVEGLRALGPAWKALEERVAPTTPFATFDWAAAWWDHLRESRLGVRDRLDVRVVRDPSGRLIGVAPLIVTHRPGIEPLSVRQVHYLGPDPNITELRGPLARPEDLAAVHEAVLDDLKANAASWDFLTLGHVPAETDLEGPMLARFARVVSIRETPCYHLNLAPTWNEFKSKLGRNIKESIRHCFNAPKRDGVDLSFHVLSERDEVASAVHDFLRLHSARADWDVAVKHRNVFDAQQAKDFLLDVCGRYAARGAFRMFQLRVGDTVIAARIGFVLGDSLYLYYSGYEPSFGRYSVMTTVVAEAIRYAIEQGMRSACLSTGRDNSKTRWSPIETLHREMTVVSPSFRGWLGYQANAHARSWLGRTQGEGLAVQSAPSNVFARRLAEALGRRTGS